MELVNQEIKYLKIYNFQIFEFLKPGRKSVRCIDIAPSSWCEWNKKKNILQVHFPKGLLTKKERRDLHHLVKNFLPYSPDWDVYNIRLRSHASKFILQKIWKCPLFILPRCLCLQTKFLLFQGLHFCLLIFCKQITYNHCNTLQTLKIEKMCYFRL